MKKFVAFLILALSLSLQSCEDLENLFKDEWYIATDNIRDGGYWANEDHSILLKFDYFSTSSSGGCLTIYDRGVFGLYGLVSLQRLDPSTEGGLDAYHTFGAGPYRGGFMLHEARNNDEMVISYSFHTDRSAANLYGYAYIEQSILPTKFHRVDVEDCTATTRTYAHRGFKEITAYEKIAHGVTADGASQLLIAIDDELQDVTNVIALVDSAVGKVGETYFDATLNKWCMVYTAPSEYMERDAQVVVMAKVKGKDKIRLYELPEIKIYKMGVGLIHGLNSNAKDCFGGGKKGDGTGGLYGYLVDEVGYEDCQVKLIDYEESNKSSFDYNTATGVVGSNLGDLYDNMLSQGIVSSKYALVGHSMGGILSRRWVQESEDPELCGVGAIITLDTPHWGSQIADGVVGVSSFLKYSAIAPMIKSAINGPFAAIRDLASESGAMIDLNDENKMTKLCGIPVHAINSDMDGFETSSSDVDVSEKEYKVSSMQPSILSNVKIVVFFKEKAEKLADLCKNINDRASIKTLETVENVLDVIYADPHHDAVVSGVSQRGGLEAQYYTMLTAPYKGVLGLDSDAFHCNTNKWWRTYETIADLLKSPYNDPRFCKTGFKAPENLKNATRSETVSEEDGYVFAEDESTYIDIKSWGMDFIDVQDEDKQVLRVEVEGSENVVANMVLVTFGEEDFNADLCRDTYYMEIPEDYTGEVQICVFGKNTENELVVDVEELVL